MKSKLYFILSMIIFGTIGIFVRYIDLESSAIALIRGFIGSLFLFTIILFTKKKVLWKNVIKNIPVLIVSSIALAANWIFLFEAYKNTTIANAVLSYYFAPVFVILVSPFVLKEKTSLKKMICIGTSLLGMFLIIQSGENSGVEYNHLLGVFYGVIAAAFYATLMLSNKFLKNMEGIETTLMQLSLATIMLMPYVFVTGGLSLYHISTVSIIFMILMGLLHTGVGFYLFFSGVKEVKAQSIAILSYIDPLTALITSVLIFGERMSALQIVGAFFLLGSTFISERQTNSNE